MAEIIFFGSLAALFYVYLGYPLIVSLLSRIRPRHIGAGDSYFPAVSIVIAAHNEEASIAKTIENKLTIDYPEDLLEILVVSDGSTDGTDGIARSYEGRGPVRFIRQEPRAGKTAALNLAVPLAKADIIVFSDANSIYRRDALCKLVRNFHDPEVGYVTGKMLYVDPKGTVIGNGCSAYMRYENFLREQETALGSVVGVDGGIDAMRKSLYRPMGPDQLPDFVQPLRVVEQGYRVVYEAGAVLKEDALGSSGDEYRMRVRVSLRALWALKDMRHLLGFRHSALFAWQLWSHKLLRYLCFFFMAGAYVSNLLILPGNRVYKTLFVAQSVLYAAALLSPLAEKAGYRFLYVFNYFVLINGAAMHAFFKFLAGKRQVVWVPRKG